MTTGWSLFVIALVLINVIGAVWMLQSLSKRKASDEEQSTTHVWDEDLTELNNPLPRWWLGLYWITVIFSVVYVIIYPGFGNFSGFAGWTQTRQYENEIANADEYYGNIFAAFADMPLQAMVDDADAVKLGRNLYANYCTTCHGSDARGARGFPNLRDGSWLYGGSPEVIQASITNGRVGVMPALGAALGEQGTDEVVSYVMSLSGRGGDDAAMIATGQQKFAQICSACHGPTGTGSPALGGANLTDDVWLHGSTPEDVRDVIVNGRVNQMPAQGNLLNEDRIRTLVAYVLSLGPAE
ncbi:MAG: cytochrome-c oxidase, cbb3-type subunit III [Gammaproteobacteria bacterium]|nr:cytochrome-c oxidase, cbb3-type subunit III [Gammaproteobacteria bacterium]